MNNNNSDFLTLGNNDINTLTGESNFTPLEEGLYNAVCIGLTVKEMQNFDKTGIEDKIEFVFQIVEGEQTYYVRSKPCKKSLHEKSGLWKILASWTKQKDAETLISKMGTHGQFNIRYFLGKPIQLTIKTKEVGDKTYPYISDYMAPKKGQSVEVKADAIPAYIVKDVKMKELVDGITIKEPTVKTEKRATIADKVATTQPVDTEAANSDELPF